MRKIGSVCIISQVQVLFILVNFIVSCAPYRTPVQSDPLMAKEQIIMLGFPNIATTSAVKAKTTRLENGCLQIKVQLVKEAFDSAFVEIKVVFLDQDGFHIEETNWQPVHLETDVITQVEYTSLSTKAMDFRMIIRRPK